MQIHVNTDNHIEGSARLTYQVETVVKNALRRYRNRITRVQVYLTDENSRQKYSDNHKRCVMEARLAGLQPITVSHEGAFLKQAFDGAAGKLKKTLKRTLSRLKSTTSRARHLAATNLSESGQTTEADDSALQS